jgi:uncharacterized protein (TIGR02646 family)
MIKRLRPPGSCPTSLDLADPNSAAAKERAAVEAWIRAGRPNPKTDRPAFKAYKSKDVSPALEKIFDLKCAYCESLYSAVHPVDVEHWRPKSEIEGVPSGGYEWLAMVWENLLPSCIDCNRARFQLCPDKDKPGKWKREKFGKANQFPIHVPANRWTSPVTPSTEVPLLLDPCVDDPLDYFEFHSSGVLLPRVGLDPLRLERATESIRVYALNRKNLVDERRRHVLRMELIFELIRFLYGASGDQSLPASHRNAASTLVTETLDRLQECFQPGVPYSQFIAQRVQLFLEQELGTA